jgi:hypothetical protein
MNVRVFWYISKTKVDAYAGDDQHWTDRLSGHVQVGLPMMVEVGAEITGPPDRGLLGKLEEIERRAEHDDTVHSVGEIGSEPPLLFWFEGRSAKFVLGDAFWVAAVDGSSALLLTGWAGNTIGVTSISVSKISSSVNPMWAVEEITQGADDEGAAARLSDSWATIFRDGTSLQSVEALPHARGLVVYAGWQPAVEENLARSGWTEPIERVVVGSPIFVEQIVATARP